MDSHGYSPPSPQIEEALGLPGSCQEFDVCEVIVMRCEGIVDLFFFPLIATPEKKDK